jgi:hypothetical protein
MNPPTATASTAPSTDPSLFEKPPSDNPAVETTTGTTAMSVEDHSNDMAALYPAAGGAPAPASDPGADCIETTTGSLPSNELISTRRAVLDESSSSLVIERSRRRTPTA